MLTQERVKYLFRYEDGLLIRNVGVNSNAKRYDVAGSQVGNGYLRVCIDCEKYFIHRVVFLYHHGYMPEYHVDHIDRDPLNNRIENLREVSQSCNIRNAKQISSNTSGVRGVHWNSKRGKWQAEMVVDNHKKYIGRHSDFTEAAALRLAAEQCIGWGHCDSKSPAYMYMKEIISA